MTNDPCPICEKKLPGPWQEYPEYPFCSKRCKLIDLGRWLGEGYSIEKKHSEDSQAEDEPK